MPCSKQHQLEQVAQECFQPVFEYLLGWRLHSLSEKTIQVLNHPQSEKNYANL